MSGLPHDKNGSNDLRDRIEALLKGYRCQHTQDDDGNGSQLVDVFTPLDHINITAGKEEIHLLADCLAAELAPVSAIGAIGEAEFNLVQLHATSNSKLSREHLMACAEKRLRELDPTNALLSHELPKRCIRPDCLDEGGLCNVECPGGEPRPRSSTAALDLKHAPSAELWVESPDDFLDGWGGKELPATFHAYALRLYKAYKTIAEQQSATLAQIPPPVVEAMEQLCYKPGENRGFEHIDYCRWCHYAKGQPHGADCVMNLLASTDGKGV